MTTLARWFLNAKSVWNSWFDKDLTRPNWHLIWFHCMKIQMDTVSQDDEDDEDVIPPYTTAVPANVSKDSVEMAIQNFKLNIEMDEQDMSEASMFAHAFRKALFHHPENITEQIRIRSHAVAQMLYPTHEEQNAQRPSHVVVSSRIMYCYWLGSRKYVNYFDTPRDMFYMPLDFAIHMLQQYMLVPLSKTMPALMSAKESGMVFNEEDSISDSFTTDSSSIYSHSDSSYSSSSTKKSDKCFSDITEQLDALENTKDKQQQQQQPQTSKKSAQGSETQSKEIQQRQQRIRKPKSNKCEDDIGLAVCHYIAEYASKYCTYHSVNMAVTTCKLHFSTAQKRVFSLDVTDEFTQLAGPVGDFHGKKFSSTGVDLTVIFDMVVRNHPDLFLTSSIFKFQVSLCITKETIPTIESLNRRYSENSSDDDSAASSETNTTCEVFDTLEKMRHAWQTI